MKRLLFLLILIATAGYFAGWPAYSMYQIYDGVERADEELLKKKINWPSMKASFKEAIRPRVEEEIKKYSSSYSRGPEGALVSQMSETYAPQIVDQIVEIYMTPKGLVRLAQTGGKIDFASLGIDDLIRRMPAADGTPSKGLGGIFNGAGDLAKKVPGGEVIKDLFGGSPTASSGKNTAEKKSAGSNGSHSSYGIDNVKSIGFNSLTELEFAVATNGKAVKPDLTTVMEFQDMDWKLTKLIPHL